MPTYEFECPSGHSFEHFSRSIAAAPAELPCPRCGAAAHRRVSAGAGLLFKGSGFYITDYGKDGKKGAKPPASGESAATSGSTGSESRPQGDSGPAASTAPPAKAKPAE